MSNATKNVDILTTSLSVYVIILIVQHNYFSNLAQILELSFLDI